MADPTDDDASTDDGADVEAADAADEATTDDEATDEAATDENGGVTTTKRTPTRRRPDPRADVAARRAATKARMDAEATGDTPDLVKKPAGDDHAGTKARGAKAVGAGTATADDPTGTKARRQAAANAKKVARPSKRTGGAVDAKAVRSTAARSGNPKKAAAAAESTRYTAPVPRAQLESPVWVPAVMFTLLGLGGIVILLTYVLWNGRPLTLGVGLALILGGILTATQYR